jgi:hypothetical protein
MHIFGYRSSPAGGQQNLVAPEKMTSIITSQTQVAIKTLSSLLPAAAERIASKKPNPVNTAAMTPSNTTELRLLTRICSHMVSLTQN